MPSSGKSTVGVVLAKTLGYSFIDTDLIIQINAEKTLQDIIDGSGVDTFLKQEETALLSLVKMGEMRKTVIATGGSAVFSEKGILALKECSTCVYLFADINELEHRLSNIKTRGIAAKAGQTITDIFNERRSLYEKYADITVKTEGHNIEEVVEQIIDNLS